MPVHFVDPLAISGKFFEDLFRFTIAISVVIDPIGSVPVFIASLKNGEGGKGVGDKDGDHHRCGSAVHLCSSRDAAAVHFDITVASFMVTGGILLFIVEIGLLTHGERRFGSAVTQGESGAAPLAFPLLTGPGSVTAVIISFQTSGLVVTAASILTVNGMTCRVQVRRQNLQGAWKARLDNCDKGVCFAHYGHRRPVCGGWRSGALCLDLLIYSPIIFQGVGKAG